MNKFVPMSPDPYIKKDGDQELAKFGHLNAIVNVLNNQALSQTGLVAHAGDGQALGTPLQQGFNAFSVVATTGDSATLPSLVALCACTPCGPIAPVVVVNSGANAMNVYPFPGESINALSVNTPISIAAGESLSFKNVSCNNWDTYGASGTAAPVGVCTDSTLTGTGLPGSCLHVVSQPATLGFAEYVQRTQAPNNSVASGLALKLTTDNAAIFDTIGITVAGAPTQGDAFTLPVGYYMVRYETSTSSVGPLAISQGNTAAGPFTADINTKAGSTTATTWINGGGIVHSTVGNQTIIVGPTDSVAAAVTTTGGAPQYIVRLTILKIG